MTDVKDQVGMLFVGILNILTCYAGGIYILVENKKCCIQQHGDTGRSSDYPPSRIFWGLMSLSYGTMPFFGLWDNIVRITEYSNEDMAGLSAFFSVMTLMFLFTATSIDYKLFGKCGTFSNFCLLMTHIIISLFWLLLFLIPDLRNIAYQIYPRCMLPIALPCAIFILLYLKKRQNITKNGIIILSLALIMAIFGYGSLIVFKEGSALRMYGWYIFCWFSVLLLIGLYYLMHIVTSENNLQSNQTMLNGKSKQI